MKIYGTPLSLYVRKVKMALNEKGIDYEMVPTDTEANITELHRLNPRGEIPTVVDGDVVITDSTIALQYIEETYPDPPLLPTDPAARVRARQLEDLGDRLGDALISALAHVFMQGASQLQDQVVPAVKRELDDLYAYLEQQLGDNDYLCGDGFSWADLGLISTVSSAQFFQMGPAEGTKLDAWLQRCLARPAVATDMAVVMEAATAGLVLPKLSPGHPHAGINFRAERVEFFLRNGMCDYVRDGIAAGTLRVGLPLMHAAALS